jgi:membrane protease YdiL (CAAX protease family)
MRFADLHPKRFFIDTWRTIDEDAVRSRAADPDGAARDVRLALYIFCLVAVSLVLQDYWGERGTFLEIIRFVDSPGSAVRHPLLFGLVSWIIPPGVSLYNYVIQGGYYELWVLGYWASWRVFGFLVLPAALVVLHPRLRFSTIGLSLAGMRAHLWIYGVLFIPVFIAVVLVSFSSEFTEYYPFYANAHRSLFDFVVWEAFYIAQFFALEFFFRGFMLQPLRRYMGASAIFAMMLPYVMIHIGKPMIECFAAIIAGIVLGTLALRTRSIWAGVMIHVSVALSMDLMAIWQVHW